MFHPGTPLGVTAAQYAAPVGDWRPDEVFTGVSVTNDVLQIPVASLHNLTSADCHPVSGDVRQLIQSFIVTAYDWYLDEVVADTAPQAMSLSMNPSAASTTGDFAGKPRDRFTLSFYYDFPEGTVTDEP